MIYKYRMTEEWKSVIDYEECYEVSNLGNIRSIDRLSTSYGSRICQRKGKLLTQSKHGRYAMVDLCKDGIVKKHLIHRLVATAFIANPENKPAVDHIDRDRFNNNASNLRWATSEENQSNRGIMITNTSGHSFIRQIKPTLWKVQINRKSLNVQKYFTSLEDAIVFRNNILNP